MMPPPLSLPPDTLHTCEDHGLLVGKMAVNGTALKAEDACTAAVLISTDHRGMRQRPKKAMQRNSRGKEYGAWKPQRFGGAELDGERPSLSCAMNATFAIN
jgi:hypothetical protein